MFAFTPPQRLLCESVLVMETSLRAESVPPTLMRMPSRPYPEISQRSMPTPENVLQARDHVLDAGPRPGRRSVTPMCGAVEGASPKRLA